MLSFQFIRKHTFLLAFCIFPLALFSHSLSQALEGKSVVIFGGEHEPVPEHWKKQASTLGLYLGEKNIELITGGSRSGIMRSVVDGFLLNSDPSKLSGVVRSAYSTETLHPKLSLEKIQWKETRHACLDHFFSSSSLFIVMPGGLGTLYELIDSLLHNRKGEKVIILFNIDGYWNPLLQQIKDIASSRLRASTCIQSLLVANSAEECILFCDL